MGSEADWGIGILSYSQGSILHIPKWESHFSVTAAMGTSWPLDTWEQRPLNCVFHGGQHELVVLGGFDRKLSQKADGKEEKWCQTMINPGKKHLNPQVPYFPMGKFHLGDSTFLYSLCQHFRRAYQCHCL